MNKIGRSIALALISVPVLWSCSSTDDDKTLGHMPSPQISIDKIRVDGVEFEPADTIVLPGAAAVSIDYTITSEADMLMVNHYYVYGGTGNQLFGLSRQDLTESGNLKQLSGTLTCDGFLPACCSFRVFVANSYGGTDSRGFYLKLPAKGLGDLPNTTPLYQHKDRKLGPSQDKNAAPLGKSFENCRKNGRYTYKDAANAADRAGTNEFGSGYIDGKLVIYSPDRHNELFPDNPIVLGKNVTLDDMTHTTFKRLDLFTAAMWNDCTSNERLQYLADCYIPSTTQTEVYPESIGYYFFSSKSSQATWFGLIYVKNLGTPTTYAQYDVRCYKYW